jgi:cytoskeletal protein CcmA (bactofilin family)
MNVMIRVAGVLAAALALFSSIQPAYALERKSGDTIVLAANETVDDDWAAAGRLVQIDGTIDGDAYVLANTVRVTGVIGGDLITAAQQVIIDDRGEVRGNVRAAGALVQLNGKIARNVTGAAQLLALGTSGRVGGNVVGAGDTVTIDGDVGGRLTGAVQDLTVQGHVSGNVEAAAKALTFGPGARIGGNFTYYADNPLAVPQSVVGGTVDYRHVDAQERRTQMRQRYAPGQVFRSVWNFLSLAWLAGSAVVGLLLLRLLPRFVAEFLGVLERRPLPSLGLGALVLIATLPAAVLIGLTVIGLPLAGLLVAGYFSGIFVGWLLLAVAVGSILVGVVRGGRPWHHGWSFLVGLLVLFVDPGRIAGVCRRGAGHGRARAHAAPRLAQPGQLRRPDAPPAHAQPGDLAGPPHPPAPSPTRGEGE